MARAGEGAGAGPGMMPIERAELATRDMDQIADLIRQQYVEHRPRFRVVDPARAEASHRATAGSVPAYTAPRPAARHSAGGDRGG